MTSRFLKVLLLLICLFQNIYAQNNFYVLKIKVLDRQTNLEIKKANIFFSKINKNFVTDKDGIVTIALPLGIQPYIITNNEYEQLTGELNLFCDSTITFFLNPLNMGMNIEEIKIVANYNKIEQKRTGQESITISEVLKLPVLGSEKDLLKAFVYMPGVINSSEGSADILVRGGLSTQNLMLLDDFPLYNTNHLLSLISSFSPSIVNEATLYKSSFPVRFGGRLSSVFEATTTNVNFQNFAFNSSISPISVDATLSFPIIKNKSGLLISGRRTFIDIFQKNFNFRKEINFFNFYNGFAKYSHKIGDKSIFSFVFYMDRDNDIWISNYSDYKSSDIFYYQNFYSTINFASNISKSVTNKISLNFTNFNNIISSEEIDSLKYTKSFVAIIKDFSVKENITIKPQYSKLIINTGFDAILHYLTPGRLMINDSFSFRSIPNINTIESAIFSDFDFTIFENLTSISGIRLSNYNVQNRNYFNIESRISLNYKLNENNSLKLSYSKMTQPIHMITNSGLGMPINIWFSSDSVFKPQVSDQLAFSYSSKVKYFKNDFLLNIDVYYKNMSKILDYFDGYSSNFFMNETKFNDWHNIISVGKGFSYGLELFLSKKTGKFNFQISYTLAWSYFHFDKINNGKRFPSPNDIRNNISSFFTYKVSKNFDFSFSFVYMTGKPVTLPINYMFSESAYSERNAFRMLDYHRMDLGARWYIPSKNKSFKQTLSFDVYNLYNRKNPYYYTITESAPNPEKPNIRVIKLQSVSLFPIIPTVTYSIKLNSK